MSVTQCEINKELFRLKSCSADLAKKYVDAVRYGYIQKEEEYFNKLVYLKGIIDVFEDYEIEGSAYVENGILHRFCKKAYISEDNSLSLESQNQKIILEESDLNCLTKEQLCCLADKVSLICSTCSTC